MYIQHVRCVSRDDIASEEGEKHGVDEEVDVVERASKLGPLVAQQGRHQGMGQQVFSLRVHLGKHNTGINEYRRRLLGKI